MSTPTFFAAGRKRRIYQNRKAGPFYVRFQFKGKDMPRCLNTMNPVLAVERAKHLIEAVCNQDDSSAVAPFLKPGKSLPLPREITLQAVRIPLVRQPAIYFLLKDGAVQYVGQSQNILGRVGAHLRSSDFDEIAFVPVPLSELNAAERRYIAALKPPLNRTAGILTDEPRKLKSRSLEVV